MMGGEADADRESLTNPSSLTSDDLDFLGGLTSKSLWLHSMEVKNAENMDCNVDSNVKNGSSNLLQIASALKGVLDDLIAGTPETPQMKELLQFVSQCMDLQNSATSRKKVVVNTIHSNPKEGTENTVGMTKVAAVAEPMICGHECVHHAALMNPAIWGGLTKDLLHLVFARLPVWNVFNLLPCVSKAWYKEIMSTGSPFKQLCADASSKLFAMVSQDVTVTGAFWVRLFELHSNTWHVFQVKITHLELLEPLDTMSAFDGGLVCFVCTSRDMGKNRRVPVVVCNPLTRDLKNLPLRTLEILPTMVQLVFDFYTKSYTVIVVGKDESRRVVAEVFHSETGVWTTICFASLPFFGCHYRWQDLAGICRAPIGPCVYFSSDGGFLQLEVKPMADPFLFHGMKGYAVVHDRLFIVYETISREETVRWVSEFQLQTSEPYWIKVQDFDSYVLDQFAEENPDHVHMNLYACHGSLLVVVEIYEYLHYRHSHQFLLDLFTGKWHEIPELPRSEKFSSDILMCDVQWDVIP